MACPYSVLFGSSLVSSTLVLAGRTLIVYLIKSKRDLLRFKMSPSVSKSSKGYLRNSMGQLRSSRLSPRELCMTMPLVSHDPRKCNKSFFALKFDLSREFKLQMWS